MFCKVLNMTFLWTFILGSFFQETNKVNLLNVWNLITLNEHISIFRPEISGWEWEGDGVWRANIRNIKGAICNIRILSI